MIQSINQKRLFQKLLFLFLLVCSSLQSQNDSRIDSISIYLDLAKDNTKSIDEQLFLAKRAQYLSNITNNDSILLKSNRVLSSLYLRSDNYKDFKTINFQNLELSRNIDDSLDIAISFHNIAWYYHHNRTQNDSAYYYYSNAVEIYDKIGDAKRQVGALVNMADIQETEKDYIGAEDNAIKALKLLNNLPNTEANIITSWNLNNLIGVISVKLKLFDKSIEYHQKALEISNKMSDGLLNSLSSKNNLAFVYKEKGDLETALTLYESVLNTPNFYNLDPVFYALTLDNIAYTKSLLTNESNTEELESMFLRAYKISDSLNDPITKLAVTIDLSKFYKSINQKSNSLSFAKESYLLAKETSSNDILLETMLLLTELTDSLESKKYLNEYLNLNDSLITNERTARNKFARIKFETDEIEKENERISREKMWLSIVSVVLLVTLFLLYIIISQRAKNKELKFKQVQQEANEEIYNLMLSQQEKVDEARAGEKKRISEELHDGILGRLFGTRLSLDSLNFSEGKEAIMNRAQYIKELMTIEQDIRKISHDLNTDFVSGSGFIDILTELIDKQTHAYQLKYQFDHTDDVNWENVSNKTKINIYRIIQESLQNIYKHAEAKIVKISIELKNDVICMSISDNGKGFDTNKSKKGIGLKNINSRVNELNGNVRFESEINKGTSIIIDIPYEN